MSKMIAMSHSTLSHLSDESGVGSSISDTLSALALNNCRPRDHFKIVSKIGEGFFADVYMVKEKAQHDKTKNWLQVLFQQLTPCKTPRKAHRKPHQRIGKPMVLKQTKCGRPNEQLKNEIKLLSGLSHVNILSLVAEIEYRSDCAIFELCAGGDLAQFVEKHGPLALDQTKRFAREITDGVDYLHSKDILHRDLKADNIFLSGDSIRIGDFGGAVVLKKGQMMTALEGSPINCAPEMIKGEGYSFPRDWWSVGIIIYQMIAGDLPFMANDQMGIFVKILVDQVAYPDHVDFATRELIGGLLEKEPGVRSKASDLFDQEWFDLEAKVPAPRLTIIDSGCGDEDSDLDFE